MLRVVLSIFIGINLGRIKYLISLKKIVKIKMILKIVHITLKKGKRKFRRNQEESLVEVDIRNHRLGVRVLLKKISKRLLEWGLLREVHQKIKEIVNKK